MHNFCINLLFSNVYETLKNSSFFRCKPCEVSDHSGHSSIYAVEAFHNLPSLQRIAIECIVGNQTFQMLVMLIWLPLMLPLRLWVM